MKEEIRYHLQNPVQLEKLYRNNKLQFQQSFNTIYPELRGITIADFWNERLNYQNREIIRGSGKELLFVILAALIAGFIAKLPAIFNISEDFFYPRNIGFIIIPFLMAYFSWKHQLPAGKIIFIAVATLAGLVFINSIPDMNQSDTSILSCIHLVLFLWCLVGFAFAGNWRHGEEKRLDFLKYNGDLLVITALILIAGGILTAITLGLFSLIGFQIEQFYFENIVLFALPAAPIIGTYLIRNNPQLVGKVSPVIATIFCPLVLIMLVIYLGAIIYSGKDPYNDRDFLMIFNVLLIGVMGIIFFSFSESDKTKTATEIWILFLLSAITIIVNGIAISAILFRITEWGITPNRAAILGVNVLILVHLFLVTTKLFRLVQGKNNIATVGKSIASFLPIYFIWTILVTFIFPLLFGFK
jgi:hypothetical protein